MVLTVSIILLVMLTGAGSVVWAFSWAARNGQFEKFEDGARSIFDAGEPVGEPTDAFPGQSKKSKEADK